MKDFKKSHDVAGQSNKMQNTRKHDVNLQKNSSLYFQIGLILCLLVTYGIFEMKFEDKVYDPEFFVTLNPEDKTYQMEIFIVEDDAPKEEPIDKQVLTNDFDIVDDIVSTDIVDIISAPESTSDILDPNSLTDFDKPEDTFIPEIFDMINVEVVPVYPGCEKKTTNKDRVKCMSDKLRQLIQKKFNTNLALQEGLSGIQKIYIQFKINQDGEVTEIITRAPHPSLEQEAERVAKKIPVMKPGLQRHKPVSVIYNLPIVFNARN